MEAGHRRLGYANFSSQWDFASLNFWKNMLLDFSMGYYDISLRSNNFDWSLSCLPPIKGATVEATIVTDNPPYLCW